MTLTYDKQLSNVAFNCKLRHYSTAMGLPSPFFASFILTPFASNASELISSLYFASKVGCPGWCWVLQVASAG